MSEEIYIFWDYENIPTPKSCYFDQVFTSIKSVMLNSFPYCKSINCNLYGNQIITKSINESDFNSLSIKLSNPLKKESSDLMIVVDMFDLLLKLITEKSKSDLENYSLVYVLISNDNDFTKTLEKIKSHTKNLINSFKVVSIYSQHIPNLISDISDFQFNLREVLFNKYYSNDNSESDEIQNFNLDNENFFIQYTENDFSDFGSISEPECSKHDIENFEFAKKFRVNSNNNFESQKKMSNRSKIQKLKRIKLILDCLPKILEELIREELIINDQYIRNKINLISKKDEEFWNLICSNEKFKLLKNQAIENQKNFKFYNPKNLNPTVINNSTMVYLYDIILKNANIKKPGKYQMALYLIQYHKINFDDIKKKSFNITDEIKHISVGMMLYFIEICITMRWITKNRIKYIISSQLLQEMPYEKMVLKLMDKIQNSNETQISFNNKDRNTINKGKIKLEFAKSALQYYFQQNPRANNLPEYIYTQKEDSPLHNPIFICKVVVPINNTSFVANATGKSKSMASKEVARNACEIILEYNENFEFKSEYYE